MGHGMAAFPGRAPVVPATAGLRGMAGDALRCVIGARADAPESGDATRTALRRLCDAAHARDLRAEELLILKDAWRELPEARRAARDDERAALSRVVTLCIEEYYRLPRRR